MHTQNTPPTTPIDWALAACAGHPDPDAWFADETGDETTERRTAERRAEAKHICRTHCPIRILCGVAGVVNDEPYGIWGGLDETERTQLAELRDVA